MGMIKKTLLATLLATQLAISADCRHVRDNSKIPSYDTTYVEKGDSFRQIYINDGKSETYILIKNDSILLWEVDKN